MKIAIVGTGHSTLRPFANALEALVLRLRSRFVWSSRKTTTTASPGLRIVVGNKLCCLDFFFKSWPNQFNNWDDPKLWDPHIENTPMPLRNLDIWTSFCPRLALRAKKAKLFKMRRYVFKSHVSILFPD